MKKIIFLVIIMMLLVSGVAEASVSLTDDAIDAMIMQTILQHLSSQGETLLGEEDIIVESVIERKTVIFRYKSAKVGQVEEWLQASVQVDIPTMMPVCDSEISIERLAHDYVAVSYHLTLDYEAMGDHGMWFAWQARSEEPVSLRVENQGETISYPLTFTGQEGRVYHFEGRETFHSTAKNLSVKVFGRVNGEDRLLGFKDKELVTKPSEAIIKNIAIDDDEGFYLHHIQVDEAFNYTPCVFEAEGKRFAYDGQGQGLDEALYSFLLSIQDRSKTYQLVDYTMDSLGLKGNFLFGELSVEPIDFALAIPDTIYAGMPFNVGLTGQGDMDLYMGGQWFPLQRGVNGLNYYGQAPYVEYLLCYNHRVVKKGFLMVRDYSKFSLLYMKDFLEKGDPIELASLAVNDPCIRRIDKTLYVNGKSESLMTYRAKVGDHLVIKSSVTVSFQGYEKTYTCRDLELGVLPKLPSRAYLLHHDKVFYRHKEYKCNEVHTEDVKTRWGYSQFNDLDFLPVDSPLDGKSLNFPRCGTYLWEAYDQDRVIKSCLFTVINQPPYVALSLASPTNHQFTIGVVLDESLGEDEAQDLMVAIKDYQQSLMAKGVPLVFDVRNLKGRYYEDSITYLSPRRVNLPPQVWSYHHEGFIGQLALVRSHHSDKYVDRGGYETMEEQMYFYREHTNTKESHGTYQPWVAFVDKESPAPSSYAINMDGYVGNLPRVGTIEHYYVREDQGGNEWTSQGSWTAQYEGTLFKTREVWVSDYQLDRQYVGEYQGVIAQTIKDDLTDFLVGDHLRTFGVIGDTMMVDTYVDQVLNVDQALHALKAQVEDLIERLSLGDQNIFLLGQPINLSLLMRDDDGDHVALDRFEVDYLACFENPLPNSILPSFSAETMEEAFVNVGKYSVRAVVKDGSDTWEFYEESRSQPLKVTIHRKPIAQVDLSVVMNGQVGALVLDDQSYDPDRQHSLNRGIFKVDVVVVDQSSGAVYRGNRHQIPRGEYRLKYRVYDEYFAASDWLTIDFKVGASGLGLIEAVGPTEPWTVESKVMLQKLQLVYDTPLPIVVERMVNGKYEAMVTIPASEAVKVGQRRYDYQVPFTWLLIDNGLVPVRLNAKDGDDHFTTTLLVESYTKLNLTASSTSLVKDVENQFTFAIDPFPPKVVVEVDGMMLSNILNSSTYTVAFTPSSDLVNMRVTTLINQAPSLNEIWNLQLVCQKFSVDDLRMVGAWSHADNVLDYYHRALEEDEYFGGDTLRFTASFTGRFDRGVIIVDGEETPIKMIGNQLMADVLLPDADDHTFSSSYDLELIFYEGDQEIFSSLTTLHLGPSIINFLYFRPKN